MLCSVSYDDRWQFTWLSSVFSCVRTWPSVCIMSFGCVCLLVWRLTVQWLGCPLSCHEHFCFIILEYTPIHIDIPSNIYCQQQFTLTKWHWYDFCMSVATLLFFDYWFNDNISYCKSYSDEYLFIELNDNGHETKLELPRMSRIIPPKQKIYLFKNTLYICSWLTNLKTTNENKIITLTVKKRTK